MSNSVNQVFQLTRSDGTPAFMARSLSDIEIVHENNLIIAPGGCEFANVSDVGALMIVVEVSSDVQAVLISGGASLPINTFSVFNASKKDPFKWLQFTNPNKEPVNVHYVVADVAK